MDPEIRAKRVQGLESIRDRALQMAEKGADATEVRDFIDRGKTELAYELPDSESATRAFEAVKKFKASRVP